LLHPRSEPGPIEKSPCLPQPSWRMVSASPLGQNFLMPDQPGLPSESAHDHFFLGHLQSVKATNAWYYNQRFLGRGGNGTAFLVTCSSGPNIGMQFVLKVFHKISSESRRKAFLKEVVHLRSLNHPAITRVFDEGTFTAISGMMYPFAVIEYVPLTARSLIASHPQRWLLQAKYARPEADSIPLARRFVCCVDLTISKAAPSVYVFPAQVVANGLHYFYAKGFSASPSYMLALDAKPRGRTQESSVTTVGEFIEAPKYLDRFDLLGISSVEK
jgi:hypothetical protein